MNKAWSTTSHHIHNIIHLFRTGKASFWSALYNTGLLPSLWLPTNQHIPPNALQIFVMQSVHENVHLCACLLAYTATWWSFNKVHSETVQLVTCIFQYSVLFMYEGWQQKQTFSTFFVVFLFRVICLSVYVLTVLYVCMCFCYCV